nr:PREDICTED: nitric oxide synthase, salivary gland isoform X3 [Bemisia tabaci]
MAREAADREAQQGLPGPQTNMHPYPQPPAPGLPTCPALGPPKKPIRLKNVSNHFETFDTLHHNAKTPPLCGSGTCLGSILHTPMMKVQAGLRSKEEVLRHAEDFLEQYYQSKRRSNSAVHMARWQQVQQEVAKSGTYQLTETELVFGAKLAWRNSARCIGRIQWAKLQVFDCRSVQTTSNMFEALCNHIKYATNKGNIRSAITVFAQRTDGKHDFRIWNPQLISYAGYKNPDGTVIGDPANVEFTEVCTKLGWKGKRCNWDILPLVLSANGHDPDYFDLPPELVLNVPLTHPKYEWFKDLGLQWYGLPAVSNMAFDCGGVLFTAAPFNGWYMNTEIGCRDLCDVNRFNMTEKIAQKMDLDTRSNVTLWKDKALVECNIAVLHSFQLHGVTIVDHHTAAETFMKHYENELRLRNGCPSDWVWIVPPMSGSLLPVFHQEMAFYQLRPCYEYQEPAWKTHEWKKGKEVGKGLIKKPRRKFHFKQIARAVKFTSKLFGRALQRRIKATVLYATETGKSELYAKKLGEILGHAFHSQVCCMSDYDMSNLEHEALLLVVASTFGNGDPPENGQEFAHNLYGIKLENGNLANGHSSPLSVGGSPTVSFAPHVLNLKFAVFALGSSAYPNFCAFGAYVDNLLGELGGERLLKLTYGDEMCGLEQAFRNWAPEVFSLACETFCLEEDEALAEVKQALCGESLSPDTVRFVNAKEDSLDSALSSYHNRTVVKCPLVKRINLHGSESEKKTFLLEIQTNGSVKYEPGDHIGVLPSNRPEIVNGIIKRLKEETSNDNSLDADQPIEVQILKEKHTSSGFDTTWEAHPKLPRCSLRELLHRFLDITTPPSPNLLHVLANYCSDENDRNTLELLATDSGAYEDWRHWRFPHLLEVLEEFPSAKPPPALLVCHLTPLQPRFYSISSSPVVFPNQVHLTVAIVTYRTQGGKGPEHYGVCSNYLKDIQLNDDVYIFVRSAPNFHLPSDLSLPLVVVGPGTGIAPFRSFWQERAWQSKLKVGKKIGTIWLFFGCRTKNLELYTKEKENMLKENVLGKVFLSLSREPSLPKKYVQDSMWEEREAIYRLIVVERGHFYVCGDCTMAEDVYQTLRKIIQDRSGLGESEADNFVLSLRDENRYHEDIFGITLRTAEVHNRSRDAARIRMASRSQL